MAARVAPSMRAPRRCLILKQFMEAETNADTLTGVWALMDMD